MRTIDGPKPMDLIAAYGTLMRGQRNMLDPAVAPALVYRRDCLIPGAIYRLSSVINGQVFRYPGLRTVPPDDPSLVCGELFAIGTAAIPAARVLAALDAYEDVRPGDPAGSMYLRRQMTVRLTDTDATKQAWVYIYNRPVAAADRIDCGDWRLA